MKEISSKKMNDLNKNSKNELNIKDNLKNDNFDLDLNDDEYLKIKEELNNYKKEQEKDIELLENELRQLKEENAKYANLDGEDNNIILDDNLKNQLKEEIINQLLPKIDEEFKKKKSEIDDELKKIEIDNITLIGKNFQELKDSLNKNDKNQIIKEENIEPQKKTEHHPIKVNIKFNNKKKNSEKENNILWKNFKDEENENDNSNFMNKNNVKSNNTNFGDIKKKDVPYRITQDQINNMNNSNNLQRKTAVIQRKKTINNLFQLFNDIFFKNEQQTSVNGDKISEDTKKLLKSKYNKYKKEFKEKDLTDYFDAFIRRNVLPIFERKNNTQTLVDNIRYNIETILVCFELDRGLCKYYYYPENNNKHMDPRERKKSTEAAIKFRKVFNVNESIINENELIRKLGKYDNDIYKVFQVIYG